jgi:hypothetical protein
MVKMDGRVQRLPEQGLPKRCLSLGEISGIGPATDLRKA